MKKFVKTGVVLLLAVAAVLALIGCPQPEAEELSDNTALASIKVAGKTVRLGTPSSNWSDARDNSPGAVFLTTAQLTNAAIEVVKGEGAQVIYLDQTGEFDQPIDFVADDGTKTFNFTVNDYLWVEVFSANHTYDLYAIQIKASTPTVNDMTLGGRAAVGGMLPNGQPVQQYGTGMGTGNANLSAASEGEIWYGSNQENTALAVTVSPEDPETTVLVAAGAAGATVDSLTFADPANVTTKNGDYIYLKASNAIDGVGETLYYKMKMVSKNADLAITDVKIKIDGGTDVAFNVGPAGIRGFGGGENHGVREADISAGVLLAAEKSYQTLDAVNALEHDIVVTLGTTPTGSTIRYAFTDFFNAQFNETTGHGVPNDLQRQPLEYQTSNTLEDVQSSDYIAVEVKSELGDRAWYAFRVKWGTDDATLSSINVGGFATIPDPNVATAAVITELANHSIDATNNNNAAAGVKKEVSGQTGAGPYTSMAVSAVATDTGATVSYAKAGNMEAAPAADAYQPALTADFAEGEVAIVRVVSADKSVTNYYKVQFKDSSKSNNVTLTALTVGGKDLLSSVQPKVFGTWGAANAWWADRANRAYSWNATTAGLTAGAPTSAGVKTFSFTAVATLAGATISYGTPSRTGAIWGVMQPTNWKVAGTEGAGVYEDLVSGEGQYLVIRVVSEDLTEQAYYCVELLDQ